MLINQDKQSFKVKDLILSRQTLYFGLLAYCSYCKYINYLISIRSVKIGGKFGFDLMWIHEKIFIPLFKIIRVFIVTLHNFSNKIGVNISQIIYKKYIVINNEYIEKNIFYNKNSIWAFSVFILIIIISIMFNV